MNTARNLTVVALSVLAVACATPRAAEPSPPPREALPVQPIPPTEPSRTSGPCADREYCACAADPRCEPRFTEGCACSCDFRCSPDEPTCMCACGGARFAACEAREVR